MIGRFFRGGLDANTLLVLAIILAVGVAVPLLNLYTAPSSALHVPSYLVPLVGKYLTYALLALSVGLIWGFAGILSLGHGAFFALGGYAMGMYLMRQIGTRGVYADPVLPDFMVFLNWKQLPWYWYGFDHFWFAAIMVVLVPGVLAFAFGWFAFRSRVTGVYLSIITQAMTFALLLAFFRNDMGFGGNNGLTDFKDIFGFNIQADSTRGVLFFASALALSIGFLLSRAIVASKFGKVLVAVRDAESRTRFIGYRVENYKLVVWTFSACMAGIAGALYVPQVGIINPSEFEPANSIEVVIWVAVGGRATLIGPIVGATLVNFAKSYFTTGALAPYWLFALGGLFIAVTLFLPKGIVGTIGGLFAPKRRAIPSGAEAQTPNSDAAQSRGGGVTAMTAEKARNSLLYLDGVTVSFDGFKALNDLSLVIEKGEMRAIIGPNGAGKTTMMDVVTGKTKADTGDIYFDGTVDLARLDEAAIADLGIGRKFQKPTVFESHTVQDNLELALAGGRGPFQALLAQLSPEAAARIDELLELIRLTDRRDVKAAFLSHGQKQWLEIGMLLAQEPKLLLVDEPAAGMTDAETEATAELLKEIAREKSVIVVEHDMAFVRALGVKVTVLHEGSVISEGTIDHVSADPRVIEVYLGAVKRC